MAVETERQVAGPGGRLQTLVEKEREGAAAVEEREGDLETVEMQINMGPQHPSTHGVFRMLLTVAGERIVAVEPYIGYMHRGFEKLAEAGDYHTAIIPLDRTDYLSIYGNEHAYVLALEKLAGLDVPERAEYIRVIMVELGRVNSHCMFYGAMGADSGATTPFLYAFALREEIQQLFEAVGGTRMFPNYFRPGGVKEDVPEDFVPRVYSLIETSKQAIDDMDRLLSQNEVFLARTRGVGVIDDEEAIDLGLSGPVLRATGVPYDVRRLEPYSIYDRFQFDLPVGTTGDCYERYLVRLEEMRESMRIIQQAIREVPGGPIMGKVPKVLRPPKGEAYARVENARGDFGIYVVSEGGKDAPYRVKCRSPSFCNLQGLERMLVGNYVADAVMILATLDIVLCEVDR